MSTEAEVEAHNIRELRRDVENRLRIAREEVENAQGALDDLRTVGGLQGWTTNLERALNVARTEIERCRSVAADRVGNGSA